MKHRILASLLVVGALLIAALPAFANHQWTIDPTNASCDAATNIVTFQAENVGGGAPAYIVNFYADGVYVATVEFYDDFEPYPAPGVYELIFNDPAFTDGVEVTIDDGNAILTVVCAGAPAPVASAPYCPNPTPADFVVRSIPAGALAFFEPSEGAYAGFNLPPGTWYAGAAENGFVEVWIACQGSNIFVPAANVVG